MRQGLWGLCRCGWAGIIFRDSKDRAEPRLSVSRVFVIRQGSTGPARPKISRPKVLLVMGPSERYHNPGELQKHKKKGKEKGKIKHLEKHHRSTSSKIWPNHFLLKNSAQQHNNWMNKTKGKIGTSYKHTHKVLQKKKRQCQL